MTSAAHQGSEALIAELSQRYGLSVDAVTTLAAAVARGWGTMAQFDHPELGGAGSWMQGGQVGLGAARQFDHSLLATVSALCEELSKAHAQGRLASPLDAVISAPEVDGSQVQRSGPWWPEELGFVPTTSGEQRRVRYAWFAPTRRLALEVDGDVTVYDTLDHRITEMEQREAHGGPAVVFLSQHGVIDLQGLPRVYTKARFAAHPTGNPLDLESMHRPVPSAAADTEPLEPAEAPGSPSPHRG